MYKVIRRPAELQDLMKCCTVLYKALSNANIYDRISFEVASLNEAYGEQRNLLSDLGGYVIVLWGENEEIENDYKNILKYHKLNRDEYEYFDKVVLPERDNIEVAFRLFLCSSDYAVEVVTVKETEGDNDI